MKSTPHQNQISHIPSGISRWIFYYYYIISIALILGFSSSKINAQSIDWLWFSNYWFGGEVNTSESLVIDPSGNIYLTGHSELVVFGDGGSAFVAKFNSEGEMIWSREFGESPETPTYGYSISIDDAGNIYSAGIFEGTRDFDPGSGTYELESAGSTDIYILKLNSSGDFVWAKRIGGESADGNFRSCLAINPDNGELYLTGYFKGTVDFDPGSGTYPLTSFGGDDIFIASLDAIGNFLWAGQMGGTGSDVGKSIARNSDGDIITTGKYTGSGDFNPGPGSFPLSGGGTFISKLSGDGGFTFALKLGNGTGTGNAITVDASNNIYTTGPFTGLADFDPGPGVSNLEAEGTDFYISKLDESGNFIWAVQMTGAGFAEANSIAVDNSGSVFTIGRLSSSADFDPGPGEEWIEALDDLDIFVSKLDAAGNFVFAESGVGPDWDWWDSGNYIAVDNAGSAYIAGDWGNVFNIGPYEFDDGIGGGGTYAYVAKFGTEGVAPLGVSITSFTNVLCYGQFTGSATAETSGGYPPYTYDWSNNESSAEINDLAAGTYTVTVTDNNGYSATAQVVITEPPLLEFETPEINDVSCNGGSDGSIQVSGTGGVPPFIFEWSNGESGPFISDLAIGLYTVTITDSNNCTQSASHEVTQPNQLEISLVNINYESCVAASDGEISISISGGTGPFNAIWSNDDIGTMISGLAPGEYSVTVTDQNNCTQMADYTILPGIPVEINLLMIHHVSCAGGTDGSVSVTGSSGVPPYTYLWSNGETGSSIDTLTSGIYGVTTTDDNGCFITAEYVVNEPPAIIAQITQTSQNQCAGDSTAGLSAVASGGTSPLTALWSNGITGFENVNLGAGIYSVTITDANACISLLSDTISEPLPIDVNAVATNETGSGANDGTAMSNPTGGIPPFSFLWNTGDTLSTLSGLSPGTYTVTITDANDCTAEGTALVNAFGCALDIMPGADLNICKDDTISIQPTAMGGFGPLSYLWSDGSTSETISVHQSGEYCVTISDEANCQDLDCVVITEIVIPPFTCPATDESAPGANDGAIQCDSLPGIISYLWSNDSTTSSIEGLSPGQYCVTVTEQNGCMATQCFYVQPGNCQMAINDVSFTDIQCAGDRTGAIRITINDGTAPITYIWSNGETTNEIKDLPAGNYAVTVSDISGCVILRSFTIAEPPLLSVKVDSVAPAHPSGSGLLSITVTGGTPAYTYLWTGPLGETYDTEDLDSLTQSGIYSLEVWDKYNCVLVYVHVIVAVDPSPEYNSIKVYPVPAKDVLIIDTEQPVSEVWISGVDGRVYKRIIRPESNQLDIAALGPGWYILRIRLGDEWYVARMVK